MSEIDLKNNRRHFLKNTGATVLGALGVGALLTACGGSGGGGSPTNAPLSGALLTGPGGGDNHTHSLTIDCA